MLGSLPVMTFLATTDGPRARNFFETTLGLRLISEDAYALVFDANGTILRVSPLPQFTPQPFTVLGWNVPDIRATLRQLNANGVTCEQYAFLSGQEEDGSFRFPNGDIVAWFKDPDGNLLSVAQLMTE